MTRYHQVRKGRIVASADVGDGVDPDAAFRTQAQDLVLSDADWRTLHYRRALLTIAVHAGSMRERADRLYGGGEW